MFRLEDLLVFAGGLVELRGGFELALAVLVLFAAGRGLRVGCVLVGARGEVGTGFVGAAREAGLLQLDAADLLFVGEEGVDVD